MLHPIPSPKELPKMLKDLERGYSVDNKRFLRGLIYYGALKSGYSKAEALEKAHTSLLDRKEVVFNVIHKKKDGR